MTEQACWMVVCAAIVMGCHHGAVTTDAPSGDGPATDAAPLGLCPQLVHLPFAALDAHDVASDGTMLYLAIDASDGPIQLQTMPVAGGTPTTLATADDERFYLASLGDTVFYGAHLSSTAYVLHQRVAGTDTVLGSVASVVPISLAASATDLYVLGSDNGTDTKLWRLSRAGGAGTSPPEVTTVAMAVPISRLWVGPTLAAWADGQAVELVALPGPSSASALASSSLNVAFSGDTGFSAREVPYGSSRTHQLTIDQITPATGTIYSNIFFSAYVQGFFADDTHLYWSVIGDVVGDPVGESLHAIRPGVTGETIVCECDPGTRGQEDATNLYGIQQDSPGQWHINVIPRP